MDEVPARWSSAHGDGAWVPNFCELGTFLHERFPMQQSGARRRHRLEKIYARRASAHGAVPSREKPPRDASQRDQIGANFFAKEAVSTHSPIRIRSATKRRGNSPNP
jgi:hypothetical protein